MPSVTQLRVPVALCYSLVILATSFRLYTRATRNHLWFDDGWAFLSMLALVVHLPIYEMILSNPVCDRSQDTKVLLFYVNVELSMAIQWWSRMSILMSIVHMMPKGRTRQALLFASGPIISVWAAMATQVMWSCMREHTWREKGLMPGCIPSEQSAVSYMIVSLLIDLLLACVPIQHVWKTQFDRPSKIRLTALFSSTLICTAISGYRSYAILYEKAFAQSIAVMAEVNLTVLTTNLTFFAGLIFRGGAGASDVEAEAVQLSTIVFDEISVPSKVDLPI